jgi:3-methyladenine DNA glycosylase/8-oxoguanine DNA glycosylase
LEPCHSIGFHVSPFPTVVVPAASVAAPAQKAVTQPVSYEDLFAALQSVIAQQTNNAEQAAAITQAFRRRIESQLQK